MMQLKVNSITHSQHSSKGNGPKIPSLCYDLCQCNTGQLAELRRMKSDGPGTPEFWRLAIKHHLPTRGEYATTRAIQFVNILALLTPKGEPDKAKKLFDNDKPLGALLASIQDGQPAVSERRLLNFIALPFEKRGEQMARLTRRLVARGHQGVNVWDIWNLIAHNDVRHVRELAKNYFQVSTSNQKQNKTKENVE